MEQAARAMASSPCAVWMEQSTLQNAATPWSQTSRQYPLLERNSNCERVVSQGCSSQGQCSYGGARSPNERNSAGLVRGIRRGVGHDGFFDRGKKNLVRPRAEKKKTGGISFGDQLLDYIEGGPKLRKWYGAPDQLAKDGSSKEQKPEGPQEEEEDEESLPRDVVLVTDADSETGQLVVLELILRRLRVRALVKDIKAATVGFGAYVEPIEGDVNDKELLKRVMRGVRAVICPGKVGKLADRELVRGVEHLVLLSKVYLKKPSKDDLFVCSWMSLHSFFPVLSFRCMNWAPSHNTANVGNSSTSNEGVIKGVQLPVNRNQGGLGALFGGLSRRDAEENEAAISSLGVPYTIIRAGSLKDEEGGQLGFRYGQGGDVQGSISREDAAFVCVEALDSPPQRALVFEVVNGREEVEDWSAVFTSFKETTIASGSQ